MLEEASERMKSECIPKIYFSFFFFLQSDTKEYQLERKNIYQLDFGELEILFNYTVIIGMAMG